MAHTKIHNNWNLKTQGGFQVGMLTIHLIKKWPAVFQTNMKVRAEQYKILFI